MFEIDYLEEGDYEKSVELYLNYDSSINYSDCTILETMFKNKIRRIATFDSDFDKIKGIEVIK
ncbi:type II toxin-antitoxin system VapC family toxin [Methanobrevibacter sp.]